MFVRQKRNRSGLICVQVIDKTNGYRVVKTIGSSRDPEEIIRLVELGKAYITRQSGQYSLFPVDQQSNAVALDVIRTLENASIRTLGPELILGTLFDEIGFNAIPETLLRDIVIARLKGYLTNTRLSSEVVIENYGQLWQIERAFRISKTDLRIRPTYHYRRRRIEAHVLVAFVAYTIYKELERRLGKAGLAMSPKRAIELCQTMYQITFTLPNDPQERRILLKMDPEQQALYDLLH